jgi:hypothetical protein
MDRIEKLFLIQDQVKVIRALKNKLSVKIDCNNNKGYDFTQLKNLEYRINYPAGKIKNAEGKTLTEAMEKVNELYQRTLVEFEILLTNQVDNLYKDRPALETVLK